MKKLSLIIIVALSGCVEPVEYGCIDEKDKFYEINDCSSYSTYSCRSTGVYANEETGYYRFTLEYNMQVVNFVSYPGDSKCLVSYGPVLRVKEMED